MTAQPLRFQEPLRSPEFCELRGYHGPFVRMEKYAQCPGWEGLGECATCGSCRHVASEELRRRDSLTGAAEFAGGVV